MRLYLAGLECIRGNNSYTKEVPKDGYILTSFYYCTDDMIEYFVNTVGVDNILIDSGAFTFRMLGLKGENIEQYTERYIQFINKWGIKYFFEMDIDMTLEDLPKVEELRKRIETGTGKKCIPVWHKTRGINYWKQMVLDYDYIAIGGLVGQKDKQFFEIVKQLVRYANSKKVKVHGLGYSKANLAEIGFYSCDSSSWNGGRFGSIYYLDSTYNYPKHTSKDKMSRIKTEYQPKVYGHNLDVWFEYSRRLRKKGFWHE